jgi:pyruvate ferredoxin oxidoreductase delta subunit
LNEQKPKWNELPKGAVSTKSSVEYETGDWGVEKPEFDRSKCTKCMLCHFYCPEGSIFVTDEGYTDVDLRFCKGCGICANDCPVKCIAMVRK